MTRKAQLRHDLERTRAFSERLLTAFRTPEQWFFQVHGQANHPLWFVGHMGHSDNFFLTLLRPELARVVPNFTEQFGMGSQPVPEPAAYPPVGDLLEIMRERRARLLELLESYSEADFDTPTGQKAPPFLATHGDVFRMASWHEAMHAGQLSVARRALGHTPILGPDLSIQPPDV